MNNVPRQIQTIQPRTLWCMVWSLICLAGLGQTAPAQAPESSRPPIVLATFFSEMLPGLRAIAQDFTQETGIALEVQCVPYAAHRMWLQTRFLGQNPPEILLIEGLDLPWHYGQAGMARCFDELIEQVNPLAPDDGPWQDAFRTPHLQQSRDVNGHLWVIPYTQYGVGFFYNKTITQQLGLSHAPQSWGEMVEQFERVKQDGRYDAFVAAIKANDAQSAWMCEMLLEALTRHKIPQVNLVHEDGWIFDPQDRTCTLRERIDLSERIVAFEKGLIDPLHAPEYAEVVRLMKKMVKTWRPDFLSLDGEQAYWVFNQGQTAFTMNGTWFLMHFKSDMDLMAKVAPEHYFEAGTFPFPDLTPKDTSLPLAGGINQNAGMRACLMLPRQTSDPWKEQAALQLCYYLCLPRVAQKILAQTDVYDISALRQVQPKPQARPLLPQKEYAYLPVASFAGYDAQSAGEFWTLWQGVLGERMSEDEFLAALSKKHREALRRLSDVYAKEIDHSFIHNQLGREPFAQ